MDLRYTNERNVQIVIYLLKAHGIKKIIVSPGATNVTFVGSIQHDPWFEIHSCVDERSAAYMACGMAEQSKEVVVLSCTGATSSRNYMPGLTEAYYRKLPILVITSTMNVSAVGNLRPQATDRSNPPSDVVKKSFLINPVHGDESYCSRLVNEAILELRRKEEGPVHINLVTEFSRDFSVQTISATRIIRRYFYGDQLPKLNSQKIGIFVGSHHLFSSEETEIIDKFCAKYNAVVFCDQTSNYFGKYRIQYALVASQEQKIEEKLKLDLLIDIGEISGDYYYSRSKLVLNEVWRINSDGEIRERFGKVTNVFEMTESQFFSYYIKSTSNETKNSFYTELKQKCDNTFSKISDIPFSNIWIASQLYNKLPNNSILYLSIFNSLRSWNFFEIPNQIPTYSNVGGFGIDGMMSSLVGASLTDPTKIFLGIVGDLNFFYDLNVIGNREVGNNVRILIINNGRGQEFRNYNHDAMVLGGEQVDKYVAAAGHNGNQSRNLVKSIAQSLGYSYYSAQSKEEFLNIYPSFVSPDMKDRPIIFEIFTDTNEESEALRIIRNIEVDMTHNLKVQVKSTIKKIIGK